MKIKEIILAAACILLMTTKDKALILKLIVKAHWQGCFITFAFWVVGATGAIAGQAAGTGTTGSVHDMNMFAFVLGDPYQRSCAFCHVPHNANNNIGPLWSRPMDRTASGLAPYTWVAPANKQISQTIDPLSGPSRLCMTCHDGVIAIDSHGDTVTGEYLISKDLNITHPIGFSYDEAMAARGPSELVDKNQRFATKVTVSTVPGTYNTVERNSTLRISDVLYTGSIVTCVTCHSVHNTGNATPDPGHTYNYLLWAKEEQSLICLSCHIK